MIAWGLIDEIAMWCWLMSLPVAAVGVCLLFYMNDRDKSRRRKDERS